MSHFMEIQLRGNETVAAYVNHFKIEANRYDFNSNTAAICISVKGLWDAHNIVAKIYEKDPKNLLEVIKLVEKPNMAHEVTATLTLPMVNMMSNYDRCFVCAKTGHIGHLCPNAQCYNRDGNGHFTQDCPEKIPHQEHHATKTGHTPNHIMTTAVGTDPNPFISDTAKEHILTGQDYTTNLTAAEAPVTIGGMHHTLYSTTVAANDAHPSK